MRTAALCLILLLTGCAIPYVKDGATDEQLNADWRTCIQWAKDKYNCCTLASNAA